MSYAIAYSQVVNAIVPRNSWDEAYFSLISLKAHLQSLPGWQRFDFWAQDLDSGDIKVVVITNWDNPGQLEIWLENGITVDSILRALTPAPRLISVELFEEIA